jgi:SAM-dependent methyltransferase
MVEALFDPVARFYDCEQQHFTEDIPFYIEYAQHCGGEVLEGACGTGRILIPMAAAGITVTGFDISQGMLDIAQSKIAQFDQATRARISVVRDDLTRFEMGKTFALIIIAFRSFQCLVTKEEQGACLERVHKHCADGGLFILDLFAPRHDYLAEKKRHLQLSPFFDTVRGVEVKRRAEDEYNCAEQTLTEDRFYEWTDTSGTPQSYKWSFRLGYLFRYEAQLLLEKYGFTVLDVFGDFKKAPYNYDSGEQIFVAQKK